MASFKINYSLWQSHKGDKNFAKRIDELSKASLITHKGYYDINRSSCTPQTGEGPGGASGYIYKGYFEYVKFAGDKSDAAVDQDREVIGKNLFEEEHKTKSKFKFRFFGEDGQEIIYDVRSENVLVPFQKSIPLDQIVIDEGIINYNDQQIEDKFNNEIFDRANQIRLILRGIVRSIHTGGYERPHSLLVGGPGSGKNLCMSCIQSLLPEGAMVIIPANMATSAGIRQLFFETFAEIGVPGIIGLDEMEKGNEMAYSPLLSVMDARSCITQMKFRSQKQMEANVLFIGAVNNYQKFDVMLEGALSSRFCRKIQFPNLSRKAMEKILEKHILNNSGKMEWIPKCMELKDKYDVHDPRIVISYLAGEDALMDGSYARELEATELPESA